jgi:expansin (peptidoglycan-binding protein)
MSSVARKPARGNWIWLGGALCAVAALAAVAAGYAIGGTAGITVHRTATAAATTPAAVRPGTGTPSPGPGRGAGSAGGAGSLAGTWAVAVFYDPGTALGGCSLGPLRAGGRYVSLPPERFGHGAACGSYLTVRGPRGLVKAEVVDLCPGCAANMINLSRSAFQLIADPGPGSARVRFWRVDNPPLRGPLILHVGLTRTGLPTLLVRRHGNPLAAVAVSAPGTAVPVWYPFTLNRNGIWVAPARLGPGRFAVRITDDRGHQVVIPGITLRRRHSVHTRRWMYAHGRSR